MKNLQFVYVDKLQTMGCFIEKVGSTSLRQTFKSLRLKLGIFFRFEKKILYSKVHISEKAQNFFEISTVNFIATK